MPKCVEGLLIIAILWDFRARRGPSASHLGTLCGDTKLVFIGIGATVLLSTSIGPIVESLCGFYGGGRARALFVVSHGIEHIPERCPAAARSGNRQEPLDGLGPRFRFVTTIGWGSA
jgi:hypothetical protein